MTKPGYVYLMASSQNRTLYLGVTSDLARRVVVDGNEGGQGGHLRSVDASLASCILRRCDAGLVAVRDRLRG
ncbi:MAG: GIY-YIG nuclease family protein, partial [Pseudomonadota bacterium]